MRKYQFYISFNEKQHTASSKAIDDCTRILKEHGYESFNIKADLNDKKYVLTLAWVIIKLFFSIERGSIMAIQYPLLSGNAAFRYVIRLLRLKKLRFFCIIHDLNELRYSQRPTPGDSKEAALLNCYDCVIVHNGIMRKWLLERGVTAPMIELGIFDYLTNQNHQRKNMTPELNTVVFAGNLSKSGFVYHLGSLTKWKFNLYGPNFSPGRAGRSPNIEWKGFFDPQEILIEMDGAFGLIWDGEQLNALDELFGNYLNYNNPHKFSLYLAAGLPVIAPRKSAIGKVVEEGGLGILIDSLEDLQSIDVSSSSYRLFKERVSVVGQRLQQGAYFNTAIEAAEAVLKAL